LVDAVGARLDLLRLAVVEDLAEVSGKTRIEHGDLSFRPGFPESTRFEETLDLLPGDRLARRRREAHLEREPILAARAERHRCYDGLDLAEGVFETLSRARLPATLEGGIAMGEELQDRLLVLQDETPALAAPVETGGLDSGDGGAFRGGIGEDEALALLPHRGTVRGGGHLFRAIEKDEIDIEVIERSLNEQTHHRCGAGDLDPAGVEMKTPGRESLGKGCAVDRGPLREEIDRVLESMGEGLQGVFTVKGPTARRTHERHDSLRPFDTEAQAAAPLQERAQRTMRDVERPRFAEGESGMTRDRREETREVVRTKEERPRHLRRREFLQNAEERCIARVEKEA
jgi:hypothetical protein